ncbi:unnamed protein product [Polarella glacialis]|uniref:EF-hand domain-containing protein n=1 Tax=Polarella glacialis TaxID=89957 RepID=A0A813ED60_POLGL|nr:unnamed protein product [Polarella glacialis]CAE8624487.1 unnamed protein product [Polarella glacialis]
MRKLCATMNNDTKQHCDRLEIKIQAFQNPKLKQISHIFQHDHWLNNIHIRQPDYKELKQSLFGSQPAETPFVRLAIFFNCCERCGESVRRIIAALDCGGKGFLTLEDWISGLDFLGYCHGCPKATFRELDCEGCGALDLESLEEFLLDELPMRYRANSGRSMVRGMTLKQG